MYARTISSRSYGNLKNGQLPYQAQAEPTVNKNKSNRSKSVKHRQSIKNPVGRVVSDPSNAAVNPIITTPTLTYTCSHNQTNLSQTVQLIPAVSVQQPTACMPSCSSSSISKVKNESFDEMKENLDKWEYLNPTIIKKIEQAFLKLMKKEKVYGVQLIAIFYMNFGEVETWCLTGHPNEDDSHSNNSKDYEYVDELKNFELTQRRQAILRQYYNKTYQYVILYRDEDLSEYYRCIGIDRRRIKEEKRNPESHFNDNCVTVACTQLKRSQIWQNLTKSLNFP